MADYVLSCCSTCDLSEEWLDKRNVRYVYFNYELSGVPYKDDFGKTIEPKRLYERMLAGAGAKTSQVSIGEYIDFFSSILEEGHDVCHVALSSGISGTYNSALEAKKVCEERYPERRVEVIDSLCATSGQGLLIDALVRYRDTGASLDELVSFALERRNHVQTWVLSSDLRFYVMGGRVSRTAGLVGGALKICVIMTLDKNGRLAPRLKVRTTKRAIHRLVEVMEFLGENGKAYDQPVFISHSEDIKDATLLKKAVELNFPNLSEKPLVFPIGATIGCHTGPGTIVLHFWGESREKSDITVL